MLKKLFYASASILMLALAYHFGASTATAQAPGNPVVAAENGFAYTADGDVYVRGGGPVGGSFIYSFVTNIFHGPTPAAQPTWGQLKAQYRK